MPVYSVEGKLGTGKTKFCVWRAQEAIALGKKVASNVDLESHLLNPSKPGHIVRIPDKPTAFDLLAIGHGNPDSYDEEKNGILILDELGTWLNTRNFQDPERAPLLDWLIHARKYGWDVYLIVQDAAMIDKQVREALIEYQVRCLRMDRVRVPLVGWLLGSLKTRWGYLPKFHLATARVGTGVNAVIAERWSYVGADLHACYDTRQVFRTDYQHGSFCKLPPWGYVPPLKPFAAFKKRLGELINPPRRVLPVKPKSELMQLIQKLSPERRIKFIKAHTRGAYP